MILIFLSRIVFDHPERVDSFTLCLLITDPDEVDEVEEKYPRRDFGLPQGDYESILPQGLKEVEVRQVELYTYWCAEIEGDRLLEDGSVTYFPILRSEDFEDEEVIVIYDYLLFLDLLPISISK